MLLFSRDLMNILASNLFFNTYTPINHTCKYIVYLFFLLRPFFQSASFMVFSLLPPFPLFFVPPFFSFLPPSVCLTLFFFLFTPIFLAFTPLPWLPLWSFLQIPYGLLYHHDCHLSLLHFSPYQYVYTSISIL